MLNFLYFSFDAELYDLQDKKPHISKFNRFYALKKYVKRIGEPKRILSCALRKIFSFSLTKACTLNDGLASST